MYESCILCLDKLTPHQWEKLQECRESDRSVHIKAPAGAGKTFIALHFMLELLDASRSATLLFAAKNLPLVALVARWIERRLKERQVFIAATRQLYSEHNPSHVENVEHMFARIELGAEDDLFERICTRYNVAGNDYINPVSYTHLTLPTKA